MKLINLKKSMKIEKYIIDALIVNGSYFFALLLRFGFKFEEVIPAYIDNFLRHLLIYTISCLAVFSAFGLYKKYSRFTKLDLRLIISSNTICALLYMIITLPLYSRMPISVYILGFIFQTSLITLIRYYYRIGIKLGIIRENNDQKDWKLTLMYITNNPEVARIVDTHGVERVFIDLEKIGKETRQKNFDSVKSNHSLEDIKIIKPILKHAELLVRINPIYSETENEINTAIANGADIIMLPFYKTVEEVKTFIDIVNGRCKTMLLLETKEAHECLEETLKIQGIDEIHIGLNDLHISYGLKFMFELLSNGVVEDIISKIKKTNIKYGFGGIAKLSGGDLPAEYIIAEHKRLGSTIAILSRSFCNSERVSLETVKKTFDTDLPLIRNFEDSLDSKDDNYFLENRDRINDIVSQIVKEKV